MRKIFALFFLLICAHSFSASAQATLDLKPVVSPAFVLMGIEPSNIEKPTTAKELSMNLLSTISEGTLPKSYAVEFAPYWFKPRYMAQFESGYGNIGTNLLHSIGISLATSAVDSNNTSAGVGFRTQFVRGKADMSKVNYLKDLENRLIDALGNPVKEKEIEDSIKIVATQVSERQGCFLELSAAANEVFINSEFDRNTFDKYGIWLTYSYKCKSMDFLLMGRNMGVEINDELKNVQDAGFRLVWESNKLMLSAEYVVRFQKDLKLVDDISKRIAGYVEYKISDDVTIHYTFGQNFNSLISDAGTLINQLGLNFGFGKSPKLNVK